MTAYFRACFCRCIKGSRSRLRIIHGIENDINGPIHMLIARPVVADRAGNTGERHVRSVHTGKIGKRIPCGR